LLEKYGYSLKGAGNNFKFFTCNKRGWLHSNIPMQRSVTESSNNTFIYRDRPILRRTNNVHCSRESTYDPEICAVNTTNKNIAREQRLDDIFPSPPNDTAFTQKRKVNLSPHI